jgi:hypothetical protein
MKTTLFTSMMLLVSSLSFAQNAPVDFETDESGGAWGWSTFENVDNPALQIIANPDPTGNNSSSRVAKFTARLGGQPYAGCQSNSAADLGPFVLDASNSTIKIMVWKSVISDVGIKFASPTGWSQGEIKVANTLINQWEELTFDFSSFVNPPVAEGQLSQLIVFPDFDLAGRTQDNVVYFDNITFNATSAVNEPLTAAPTPTEDAADVISMFSNAYTNVNVDTWRTPWSSAVLEDILIQGNETKKYSNLDFVGIETTSNPVNITGMTTIHMDVWSPNFTFFGVKLVDFGADGAFGGGDDVEHQVNIDTPVQGEWVSLDIPLSQFTGLTTFEHIAQYILVGKPTGTATVFVDNVYFYNGTVVPPVGPLVAAPAPIHSAADVISMFSNTYTNVTVDTWRTSWSSAVLEDILIVGNDTKKYSNLDFVGIETVASPIDATQMTHFRIDVWSADFTSLGIKLVDFGADAAFGGGDDVEHQVNFPTPVQNEWLSLDIPLSDFTGLTTKAHMAQYILVGQPTSANTVFVDNVYFRNSSVGINDIDNNSVAIYPNPVKAGNDIRVNMDVNRIDLFDLSGKVISTSNNSVINTNGLSEGIYFLKIQSRNGDLITKKLAIN